MSRHMLQDCSRINNIGRVANRDSESTRLQIRHSITQLGIMSIVEVLKGFYKASLGVSCFLSCRCVHCILW